MRIMCGCLVTLLAGVVPGVAAYAEEESMAETLRIACVQMEITPDLDANLARIERGILEGSSAGARVVVFPETALSGFDKDTVTSVDWQQLDAAMERVAAAAKSYGVYVLYGSATRSGREKPYNSAILVGPDGQELTRYHKMVPEGYFEPGDHLALFKIDGVPATVIVCHDERFPELVRIPVLAGARICFYISYEINALPSALKKMEGYRAQLIARAAENGIWVVQSNGIGPLARSERISLGHSRIVAPDGVVIAEAPALKDHMLVQDIRPGDAGRGNALESLQIGLLSDWWKEGIQIMEKGAEPAALPPAAALSPTTVRLALMKAVPEKWNLQANFDVFLSLLDEGEKAGATLFVTPECWLDGYAAPDKASTPERLRKEAAQDLTGSAYLKRVGEEARKRSMFICFGFTSLEQDRLYNAAGLWGPDGALIGVYHKTHLQNHDSQFSAGEDLPVWMTPWGPLGIMICADRRWPETARTLRLKGAKLILNPSYGMSHEANEWWMRTRGYENECWIAFAHPKTAFVVNPNGGIAAKRNDEAPGVLICDCDLNEAGEKRHLRDRRPDLYGIITQPK